MIALRPKINVDKRGKITTGIKAISERTQKEYPKATDYFVITDFPELMKSYGEKPTKLVIFFPDDDDSEIEAFFNVDYVLYGGNQTLIRKCNGNECLHRIDEEIAGKKYVAGEISDCVCTKLPEDDKKRCKIACYAKAYIADKLTGEVNNTSCYLFYTGSRNSAENLYSEIKKIRNLLGGCIKGIPFGLSVEMVSGKTDAKQKFPIWSLKALGSVRQLRLAMESYLFDYKEILKLDAGDANPQLPEHPAEETPVSEVSDDEDFTKELMPEHWVGKIKELKSLAEVNSFEKSYHLELSQFGGADEALIQQAIEEKKTWFTKNRQQT